MQIFDSNDTGTFYHNGRKYIKNFIVMKIGTTNIAVYNAYDSRLQLIPSTHFSNVQVDGVTYSNQADLMSVLSSITFSKYVGSGGGTTTGQNNIPKNYTYYFAPTGSDVTPSEVANKINGLSVPLVILETHTPVLINAIRTIDGASKKFIFLFMRGKGMWGGENGFGTSLSDADFRLISTLILTPADVEDDENSQINYLGEVEDGNFISVANENEWHFTGATEQYYFSYTQDDVLYFALFVGTPGIYGGGMDNDDFSEDDFVITTNSEVEPVPIPTLQQVANAGSTAILPTGAIILGGGADNRVEINPNTLSLFGANSAGLQLYNGNISLFGGTQGISFWGATTGTPNIKSNGTIDYGANYSANYTNRSLVDKGFVMSQISASTGTTWGNITGTLSAQTNLQTALNAKLTATLASDAETQILSSITEDNKVVSRLKLFNWAGSNAFMVKVRAVTLSGLSLASTTVIAATDTILSAIGKLQAQISNKSVASDYDTTPTDIIKIPTIKSTVDWKNLITFWKSSIFSGTGNRIATWDATGQMTASLTVVESDRKVTNNDIISVAIAATYNIGNNYTDVIVPTNGATFYEGQYFFSGNYKYEAETNNTVRRIMLG